LVNAHAVRIVKALYDFAPLQQDDLAFRKGDKMKILRYDDASVHSTIFVTSHALHGCGLLLHTDGVCPTVCWSKPWAVQKRMNRSRCRLAGGQTRVGSVNHVCMYVCMYVIFIRSDKRTSNNKHKKQSQNYVHYKAAKPKNLFHSTKLYKERIRKDFLWRSLEGSRVRVCIRWVCTLAPPGEYVWLICRAETMRSPYTSINRIRQVVPVCTHI